MNFIFGHDTCTQGHCVSAYVVFRFFNAMMKGLTRNLTIQARADANHLKTTVSKRKILKLSSAN